MLPSHFFETRSYVKNAVLAAKHSYKFYVLGFSGQASAKPYSAVNSVIVSPADNSNKEDPELLAVTAIWTYPGSKGHTHVEHHSYILPVYYLESNIQIGLEEIYVPKKLLQPYTNYLQLNDSSEHIFTTDKQDNGKETYVSDPNLLCQYAAGRATFEELLGFVQKPEKERAEIEELSERLQNSRVREQQKEDRIEFLVEELETLADKLETAEDSSAHEYKQRTDLEREVEAFRKVFDVFTEGFAGIANLAQKPFIEWDYITGVPRIHFSWFKKRNMCKKIGKLANEVIKSKKILTD